MSSHGVCKVYGLMGLKTVVVTPLDDSWQQTSENIQYFPAETILAIVQWQLAVTAGTLMLGLRTLSIVCCRC